MVRGLVVVVGLIGWWMDGCGCRMHEICCMHIHACIYIWSMSVLCCASVRAYLGVGRGGVGDEGHGLLLVVAEGLDHLLLGINMYVVVCCGD